MADFGLTDQGFLAPRAADLLEQIRDDYEQKTGLTIDWDADVFLGSITAVLSERGGALGEMLQAIADSRDPDNATGHMLDTVSAIVGVERQQATFSVVDLDLTGDTGTIVEAGTEVEATDGQTWILQDTVEIDGTTTVEARPPDEGRIVASANTITEIINPVDGWDSVDNPAKATPGQDRETDAALRLRRRQSLQIVGASALGAIRSNLLDVDGVTAAIVVDNDSDEEATVDGLTLDPHSLAVVVYPTLSSSQQEALALEIYERAPAGIKTIGDQSATVTGLDDHDKAIRWSYADEIAVTIDVEITGVSAASVEDEIETAIESYFEGINVGDPVRRLAILGIIADVDGVESAPTVDLNSGTADIVPEITEIATLSAVTVADA